jgi:hypothetical protein
MRTSVPFSGSIQTLGREHMVVGGLPNDPAIRLSASAGPSTYPLQITNPGVATVAYFVDARLDRLKLIPLPNTVECSVPTIPGACAGVLVPPETRFVNFLGRSSAPLEMEVVADTGFGWGFNGSPDLFARPEGADVVEATLAVPEVPYGTWLMRPAPVAPFGSAGATPASFTHSAFALTQPFDPAVSSDTGNIWIDQMQGTHSFEPLVLGPAQTGTVAVTLTPDPTQVGKTISGFVYIDTYSPFVMTGDEVVRIPYAYTIAP